ncbi:hypothetical protein F3Y22_tig00110450pilonHSYRG00031 [Hibiscus syriacus]|uniref:Uncharacterized protein n=1 Tax=Hibiscus syriacus TaxID=106335 RepID=A0A6A3AM10_HIBSY|nr:hypothetical protein F3Y22_tig00110450pilonHSYRG00031 [Hibiscus syriacus]
MEEIVRYVFCMPLNCILLVCFGSSYCRGEDIFLKLRPFEREDGSIRGGLTGYRHASQDETAYYGDSGIVKTLSAGSHSVKGSIGDMKFGEILVPKGVNIWIMVLALHTGPEIWCKEAYTFDPNRFEEGIAGACKLPQTYMPFGVGPRVCLGQNLAMVELKLVIALLLCNFASPFLPTTPILRFYGWR